MSDEEEHEPPTAEQMLELVTDVTARMCLRMLHLQQLGYQEGVPEQLDMAIEKYELLLDKAHKLLAQGFDLIKYVLDPAVGLGDGVAVNAAQAFGDAYGEYMGWTPVYTEQQMRPVKASPFLGDV